MIDSFNKAIQYTERATVLSKTSQIVVGLISFEFSNKGRKNFKVDINTFNLISEGEKGLLTYRKNGEHLFFVDFKPNV